MLKLRNVSIDFHLGNFDDLQHAQHTQGLYLCDGARSLSEKISSLELLSVGAVDYLSKYGFGFQEGSLDDIHLRELVRIGKGQVGTSEKEWILDACVLVIEKEPAVLYGQQCSQHAMVTYFQDGSYTPVSPCILRSLTKVDWSRYGLTVKEVQSADCIGGVLQFQEQASFSSMHIILHTYHLSVCRRTYVPGEATMVKAAVEKSMNELKTSFPHLFFSQHATQMRRVVPHISRCIAGLITSSTEIRFQKECADIMSIRFSDLDQMEACICKQMFNIIEQLDGNPRKRSFLKFDRGGESSAVEDTMDETRDSTESVDTDPEDTSEEPRNICSFL